MHPKYVILLVQTIPGLPAEEMPFLVASPVAHKMLERVGKPVAAGFYDIAPGGVHAWGRSESLNLESCGQKDADLIAQWFAPRLFIARSEETKA